MKLIWCLNPSPVFTIHAWAHQEKVFWHKIALLAPWQGLYLAQLPPNTSGALGVAFRAPCSAPGGGQELALLTACSVSSNCGCLRGDTEAVGSAQRTQQAPGCKAAAAKDVPGALWHQQSRETPHTTYFSTRKDSWVRLSSALSLSPESPLEPGLTFTISPEFHNPSARWLQQHPSWPRP